MHILVPLSSFLIQNWNIFYTWKSADQYEQNSFIANNLPPVAVGEVVQFLHQALAFHQQLMEGHQGSR
jgi:hypothetical protein